MPEQQTIERAHEDAREGKSPSTQAGEFIREEIHHIREGKHGARSPQQAIAIGLSKARRAGIMLAPPKGSNALQKKAAEDERAGERRHGKVSPTRSRATEGALRRESRKSANSRSLSRQARAAAAKRGKKVRSRAATKAARTRKARS
ncbi:MAG: DNA-binding protein [Candidatus Sulfotelmatobacter sp.]